MTQENITNKKYMIAVSEKEKALKELGFVFKDKLEKDNLNQDQKKETLTDSKVDQFLELAAKNTVVYMDGFVYRNNLMASQEDKFDFDTSFVAKLMREAVKKASFLGVDKEALVTKTAGILLLMAARENKPEVVKTVLGYVPDLLKDQKEAKGTLQLAASLGHVEVMNEFLYHKADINRTDFYDYDTPLYCAAIDGQTAMVRYLLSKGALVLGHGEKSPVAVASGKGYDAIVESLLLRAPKERGIYSSSMRQAASSGHVKVMEKLFKMGEKTYGPLFLKALATKVLPTAVIAGKEEAVRLLIQKKADVKRGQVMVLAAMNQNLKVLSLLINNGGDVNESFSNMTPLGIAVGMNNQKAVDLLLSNGAKADKKIVVYIRDEASKQEKNVQIEPIVLAAAHSDEALLLKLIEKGADINAQNGFSKTVLDVYTATASDNSKSSVFIETLREKGAKTGAEIKAEMKARSLMNRLKKVFEKE